MNNPSRRSVKMPPVSSSSFSLVGAPFTQGIPNFVPYPQIIIALAITLLLLPLLPSALGQRSLEEFSQPVID
ncbi:hypothetical protein E2C01_026749 [Portunus trituberculatus]|uniref:Uncharacterized protein n=1 Tax=Portunus trituberculatus TaxID=210409 RepID=A0A5B7EGC5_PORTR|nr:hypothetical protein [Portunus trituberculatus]